MTGDDDDVRSTFNMGGAPMTHVVDDECFVFPLPLMLREAGEQ